MNKYKYAASIIVEDVDAQELARRLLKRGCQVKVTKALDPQKRIISVHANQSIRDLLATEARGIRLPRDQMGVIP